MLHDRVLGSLGRRLQMTSNQGTECNGASVSSLYLLEKMENKLKLIVSIYFGTKTSFLSLESELSFDSEDSEVNFDRARSSTVNSLLRALRAIYNISSDEGEDLFAEWN